MVLPSRRADAFVGERVRIRRNALGMTQEQLASALGISYQQVQKYETGTNRISAGRLFEIARALGVDVAHFYSGMDAAAACEPLDHGGKSRAAIDLVRNFAEIDDGNVRTAIAGLIKSLARQVDR